MVIHLTQKVMMSADKEKYYVEETGQFLRPGNDVYSIEYGENYKGKVITISATFILVKFEDEHVEYFYSRDQKRHRNTKKPNLLRLIINDTTGKIQANN